MLSHNVRNKVPSDAVPEAHTIFKARVNVAEHTQHKFVCFVYLNVFTYALNIPKCNEIF